MLQLKNIVLRRGSKVVLSQATVTLHPGEKVGLVGRNGAGKSTLFALMNGSLQEDQGEFSKPDAWLMSQVDQHMPETDQNATDFVLEGDTRLNQALKQLRQAELDDDGEAMAHAHAELDDAGGHHARARAQAMLMGLGFKNDELENPVNSFSGGWRMRLQLSRALMCPADLMLLDEPTNHLDLDALVWLEDWLKRYEGTMIVISHDRDFLDAVSKTTLYLENGQLTRYSGNFSSFEEQRAQQLLLQQSAYEKQQDRIAHLQKFIDRFKAKASKAKQAQSRVKALERMQRVDAVLGGADFEFEFKKPDSLPNPMLSLQKAELGYSLAEGPITILRDVGISVLAGQRIGILGANGQGKSTLVKTIADDLRLISGEMVTGKGLKIGYFAQQELDVLKPSDSPLQHFIDLARHSGLPAREQELRNYLGTFRFVDAMVTQQVGTLSGGEKARLVLAMLVWQKPNLLLLDEPTNHLDVSTRESLGLALNGFEGTVLLVSHDRALLRAVCDEFWVVGQGRVQMFAGDLDDYRRMVSEASRSTAVPSAGSHASKAKSIGTPSAPTVHPARGKDQRKQQAQLRAQKIDPTRQIKKDMAQLEQKLGQLQDNLVRAQQGFSPSMTVVQSMGLTQTIKAIEQDIAHTEAQWMKLGDELEALLSTAG